jgi:acyl-CoA dehydrogenase
MAFEPRPVVIELTERLNGFMADHVYPNEPVYWRQVQEGERFKRIPIVEELKAKARAAGLWNLFYSHASHGYHLSNLDFAPLCEIMGKVHFASEVFNCSAPDTGNMETLHLCGSDEQKRRWLDPLLAGEIRSCFSMTEPAVASSDATNIECSVASDGDNYVINGRKWFSSSASHPACELLIVMGKSDPANPDKYRQQSMLLVPRDTPGVRIVRNLSVFGYDDAPFGHAEIIYDNVRVPAANMLLGPGRGFEIAQLRLGPGRIHHCMRLIGLAERALERMCRRSLVRFPFGKALAQQSVTVERIANSRIMIEQARLLTQHAAWRMDEVGNKVARADIAMIKVAVPNMACQVIDWAIQAHGGGGVSDDFGLAYSYARARAVRLADGPDEVHRAQIGRLELNKYRAAA